MSIRNAPMKRSMAVKTVQPTGGYSNTAGLRIPVHNSGFTASLVRRASPWLGRPRRPSPHELWGLRLPRPGSLLDSADAYVLESEGAEAGGVEQVFGVYDYGLLQ